MGSRGAFINVNINDFSFTEGGQHYKTLGILSNKTINDYVGPDYYYYNGTTWATSNNS